MRTFWAVAIGAALGGVARYYLASALQQRLGATFPWGTLVVNVSGSLLLGVLIRYALVTPSVSVEMRALLTTGFCGGYTTFSAFSLETLMLFRAGLAQLALIYVVVSLAGWLLAVWLGHTMAVGFNRRNRSRSGG